MITVVVVVCCFCVQVSCCVCCDDPMIVLIFVVLVLSKGCFRARAGVMLCLLCSPFGGLYISCFCFYMSLCEYEFVIFVDFPTEMYTFIYLIQINEICLFTKFSKKVYTIDSYFSSQERNLQKELSSGACFNNI